MIEDQLVELDTLFSRLQCSAVLYVNLKSTNNKLGHISLYNYESPSSTLQDYNKNRTASKVKSTLCT